MYLTNLSPKVMKLFYILKNSEPTLQCWYILRSKWSELIETQFEGLLAKELLACSPYWLRNWQLELSFKLSLCWRNADLSGTTPILMDIAGTDSLPPWGLVLVLLQGKFMDLILEVVDLIEEQMLTKLPLFFWNNECM